MVFLRIALLVFWVYFSWTMGQIPSNEINTFGTVVSLSSLLAAALLYLLPTYEAVRRKHASLIAVSLINVFLG